MHVGIRALLSDRFFFLPCIAQINLLLLLLSSDSPRERIGQGPTVSKRTDLWGQPSKPRLDPTSQRRRSIHNRQNA